MKHQWKLWKEKRWMNHDNTRCIQNQLVQVDVKSESAQTDQWVRRLKIKKR